MPTDTPIAITVNGEPHDVSAGSTLADVLRQRGLDPERTGIAAALNGTVVRRAAWVETHVAAGDDLEVITATQGG